MDAGHELDELSLSEIYESTVQSYGKVLSSHEEILASKVQLMENHLLLIRKQVLMISRELEKLVSDDIQLNDICQRLRNIALLPGARNSKTSTPVRPASMIAPSSPRLPEIKRCSSESQRLTAVKIRKKSVTLERLEDRNLRARNSVCHAGESKVNYELSSDLLALQENTLARSYGDPARVIRAARTIQRCWRRHTLNRRFDRIKLETPYRTKSMSARAKPVIHVRTCSSSSMENLVDTNVRHQIAESPPAAAAAGGTEGATSTSPDQRHNSFQRNDISRQIKRNKRPGGGGLVSSCSEFSISQVPKRRGTAESIEPPTSRPHSSSWSYHHQSSANSSACPSPLGERVSGDGAEFPDEPEIQFRKSITSPIAEKYNRLWSISGSPDLEQRQLCRNYKLGVYKFNKAPAHGVKHLTSCGIVGNSPAEIASFLLNGKGLSLSQIGNFITDLRKQLSMDVLEEFMKQIDFTDLPFERALRHFISKLRLPGEAQKIDKLMEVFAERYCTCNPGSISESQDTVYVLAFSVIILQTDLHNPQIKLHRKMDLESFVLNNRGIDNGSDLPRELLEGIYDGVKKEPIISGRDHIDFLESIDKSIIGKKFNLMEPWRMLVMSTQMQEVLSKTEKPLPEKHIRHIFLFNDLLVITKQVQIRGKATTKTTKERSISTCCFQFRSHLRICSFKAESFATQWHPYAIRLVDGLEEDRVLLELAAYSEDERTAFLTELTEVTWVYRALENDRIGTLGVSEKIGQSTLSLHSYNSDTDANRRHTHTLGRRFFRSTLFKSANAAKAGGGGLSPSSSLFYTQGISSSDARTSIGGAECSS